MRPSSRRRQVQRLQNELRPLPLKVAAVVGVLLLGVYVALLLDDRLSFGSVFWGVLLALGIGLAWFSDQLGRRAAQLAAALFFVLGILSSPLYALAFLVMVVLCVVGFVKFDRNVEESP